MKKVFVVLLLFLLCNIVFAEEAIYDFVHNGETVFYDLDTRTWSKTSSSDNSIVLVKKIDDGEGSCSVYNNEQGKLVFALSTNLEFIINREFIIVDNNLLKYSKLVYEDERFMEVNLTEDELKEIFKDYEIFKLSQIAEDDKIWIHKPLFKKKYLLLLNDTDRFYHSISIKNKNVQHDIIKGLVTISNYGRYCFNHFGKRDGKLILYVR